jgi:hypothetical protein
MDILNSIPVLSELNPVKPVSLQDIQSIHSSLTLENPLTFQIFLSKRPDLEETERKIYIQIIERLKANEKFRYEAAMASMVTANLPSQPFKGATDVYDA